MKFSVLYYNLALSAEKPNKNEIKIEGLSHIHRPFPSFEDT